jgi:1-aminocyclopropane-1-carboxylate deaminase
MAGPMREPRLRLPSPLQEVADERWAARGVRLLLKRDDLIHPDFPGNKWRKLQHNLVAARAQGHDTLLTFGGAYSNHLVATAAAGYYFGFATVGVVRGEERLPLNPMLARAAGHGMSLVYLDRARYRRKEFEVGDRYLLPEGGANSLAVRGCAELPAEIGVDFDVICCSSGTGATVAGIATALRPGQRAIGFSALKGGGFLADDVRRLQGGQATDNVEIETEFHFGGFARATAELDAFIVGFRERHGIALDRVYEAKMMYGLQALLARGRFDPGTVVVAVM